MNFIGLNDDSLKRCRFKVFLELMQIRRRFRGALVIFRRKGNPNKEKQNEIPHLKNEKTGSTVRIFQNRRKGEIFKKL